VAIYGTVRGGVLFSSATFEAYSERVSYLNFDAGYNIGFSGGFQLNEWVRWDVVDFSYFKAGDLESSWIAYQNGLIALYQGNGLSLTTGFRFGDFRTSSRFHPYFSLGLGASRADLVLMGEETTEWGMDVNVGVGVEYKVFSHMAVGIRYQFRWADMEVKFPPITTPSGLRMVDLSMQYHTLALEFVFF
jgi:opacity protein-like surface antigen